MPVADEAARWLREQNRRAERRNDIVAVLRAIHSGRPLPDGVLDRAMRRAAWRMLDADDLDDL